MASIRHLYTITRQVGIFLLFVLVAAGISACSENEPDLQDVGDLVEATRTPIVIHVPALTSTPIPTQAPAIANQEAPVLTPTPLPTLAVAPDQVKAPKPYDSPKLYGNIRPVSYIKDQCEYLQQRWDPENSTPGTFVVPIMYHAIGPPGSSRAGTFTPNDYYRQTIAEARRLGFETVTAEELADFVEYNKRIPERSMILILDDRRPRAAEEYLMPTAASNNWTVTLAWNVSDTDNRDGLWERVERWHETGYVDIQSHGRHHRFMTNRTPEKWIRDELFGPIPIHEEHFGYRPIAFIWPGGLFTKQTVNIAREADYRIAFTIFPRGPIMYNWIPQGSEERQIGDPLMLLPRYWGHPGMVEELRKTASIGDAARAHALEQYPMEAAYFRANCGGELPQPGIAPTS